MKACVAADQSGGDKSGDVPHPLRVFVEYGEDEQRCHGQTSQHEQNVQLLVVRQFLLKGLEELGRAKPVASGKAWTPGFDHGSRHEEEQVGELGGQSEHGDALKSSGALLEKVDLQSPPDDHIEQHDYTH